MLYTAAWMAILALLSAILWASGKVDWRTALRGLAPACLLFAFICLTPWYLCRVRPLRLPHRAIGPSLGAALVGRDDFICAAKRNASRLSIPMCEPTPRGLDRRVPKR